MYVPYQPNLVCDILCLKTKQTNKREWLLYQKQLSNIPTAFKMGFKYRKKDSITVFPDYTYSGRYFTTQEICVYTN